MDFGKFEEKHFDELDSPPGNLSETTATRMDTGSTMTLAPEELIPLSC